MKRKRYAEMTDAEKKEYLTKCRKRGGKNRAKAFSREYQQAARAKVSSQSCAANGRKGFEVTREKYGEQQAQQYAANYRIEHPSQPEQWLIAQLDEASVPYRREVVLEDGRSLDFVLDGMRAIELNGHQAKACFGESQARLEKHIAKVQYARSLGYKVFVFDWLALADRRKQIYQLGDFVFQVEDKSTMAKHDELPF